ncbi:CpaF family protein [bacterium C-53]|nr:CpaF family protein [Lachnospiraceae bacterium]NBI03057.1 CpaF family protein [Lachnospiraceae bacterium]RKJ10667.1 CpaF family protein [bacterium C-53]
MSCKIPELRQRMKEEIYKKIDLSREVPDEEIEDIIDECILRKTRSIYISLEEKRRLKQELFYSIRKLDLLQELVDDSDITEIMVNGTENIFIERKGTLFCWEYRFESKEKLLDVIQQIVAKSNRVVNEASPIVDARLENGSRVNVVLSPVALNGPILTIRRFPDKPIDMTDLIKLGTVSLEVSKFLEKLVKAGYNIFISGGTGSGKTTFLNALSNYIPGDERVITIEDSAELQLQGISNLVRMETRNANMEGCREITIRDLIKSSLRMRPDRVIVGEVRDSAAVDLMSAFLTGHDGSLSTGHANSAADMISRLETMVLMGMEIPLPAIRRQIASAIDIIIHLGRMRDKSRKVLEIVEVLDYKDGEISLAPLFLFEETECRSEKVEGVLNRKNTLKHIEKLLKEGIPIDEGEL